MRVFSVLTVLSVVLVSAAPAADVGGQVDALLQGLGSDDTKALEKPQNALFTLVANASRPGAEEERAAVCKAVAERLPKANPQARVWLLHELSRGGRAECVSAVAAQLADKAPTYAKLRGVRLRPIRHRLLMRKSNFLTIIGGSSNESSDNWP
jgi:hypothetical protein